MCYTQKNIAGRLWRKIGSLRTVADVHTSTGKETPQHLLLLGVCDHDGFVVVLSYRNAAIKWTTSKNSNRISYRKHY